MDSTVRGNVLVVEDDQDCGQMVVRILSNAGYGVRWAPTREAAVAALNRYLYDYIILDLRMPGMATEQFLKVVAMSSREINIILTTAEVDAAKEAKRLGLTFSLGKPFLPEELLKILRDMSSGIRKIPEINQPRTGTNQADLGGVGN